MDESPASDFRQQLPGDWLSWTSWSRCSKTCDVGTRLRSRICNMTSYAELTAPCLGNATHIEDCHTWNCSSYARTCTEYAERGLLDSGENEVFLKDSIGTTSVETVYCDMTAENGVGVTIIRHDKMNRTYVTGYESAGEFKLIPKYEIDYAFAASVVDLSASCKQHLLWECKGAVIHNPHSLEPMWTSYFINRTNEINFEYTGAASYFPGGRPGSNACACDIDKSCFWPNVTCNCDANQIDAWLSDGGYVTNKQELPIKVFAAGDTGWEYHEEGYITVGPVICFGNVDDVESD